MARPHRLQSAALHYDNTAAEALFCLIFLLPFYTRAKLEDHVSWNISQTCDSFTEKKEKSPSKCVSLNCGGVEVTVNVKC